jgi:hypothetical protein
MPVALTTEFAGATLEQYDQAIKSMGFTPGGPAGPGCLFHWVTATDDGIRVTDVWESREHYDKFEQETIIPKVQEVGFPNAPQTTFYDVHNHLTAG